ncbi:MAG: methyltransferase domain-containing protein [Candidatus Aminicenantes bacterium]|nr:methyltransferase domain-containing protein [Candidatus Aminicenantes bacterium]
MNPRRPKGSWYLPGRLYDLASAGIFRGLRRRIAAAVERDGLYPWLDVCCGTGSQLRGQLRGHVPMVRVPDFVPDLVVCGLDKSYGFVRYAAARAPGVPFVCGDAGRLPFKDGSFRAVSVSFGLHDKSPDLRRAMMAEARRVLAPSGRFVAVDFENPWSLKSKVGALAVRIVERLAGSEHYRNGREFLSRGGLRAFLRENGFVETARHDVETVSISVVVASPR